MATVVCDVCSSRSSGAQVNLCFVRSNRSINLVYRAELTPGQRVRVAQRQSAPSAALTARPPVAHESVRALSPLGSCTVRRSVQHFMGAVSCTIYWWRLALSGSGSRTQPSRREEVLEEFSLCFRYEVAQTCIEYRRV